MILLGAIVLIAGIGLIMTRGGAENNSDVLSLLDKVKKFASAGIAPDAGGGANANAEKYEKSEDGKVVYAFKPKSGAAASGGAESGAKAESSAEAADSVENPDDTPDEDA
jgi:hypothetical protein